ncbi:hypothetical protein D3C72_1213480 [compost metagenome]
MQIQTVEPLILCSAENNFTKTNFIGFAPKLVFQLRFFTSVQIIKITLRMAINEKGIIVDPGYFARISYEREIAFFDNLSVLGINDDEGMISGRYLDNMNHFRVVWRNRSRHVTCGTKALPPTIKFMPVVEALLL